MIRRTKRKVPYKDIHAKVLFMVEDRKQSSRSSETVCRSTGQSTNAGETCEESLGSTQASW